MNELQQQRNINRTLRDQLQMRNQHLSALGQKPSDAQIKKDFYVYEEDFSAVTSGSTATGNINIQADSDFVLQKLTFFADIAAAAQTDSSRVIPLMTVQIKDTGSGRDLIESSAPVSNIFGSGRLPFILPTPKLFLARSTIAITVDNFDAAVTYNLRLSFVGYKVFRL
jgi:hypothetical protein